MDSFQTWYSMASVPFQYALSELSRLLTSNNEKMARAAYIAGLRRGAEIAGECAAFNSWPDELRRGAVETKFKIEAEAERIGGEDGPEA